jgi:hypothetical protein
MPPDERPKLSLDPLPGTSKGGRKAGVTGLLLVLVLLLQAAILYRLTSASGEKSGAQSSRDPKEVRELATTLEQKSLAREAAREWERHLERSGDDPESPQILYRAGALRMEAGDYGEAVRNFVAAEQEARRKGATLPAQAGSKVVDCLRRLGLYGEVGRELSRRVTVGKEGSGDPKVVATYAGEKITEADLDRMIERRVDELLALEGGGDEERRKEILKGLNTPQHRRQLLQEILRVELLARRARETGVDKEGAFRDAFRRAEEGLLASRYMDRELSSIRPTEVDLQSYYSANKESYRRPESASVTALPLKADETPAKALEGIAGIDDFRKRSTERTKEGQSEKFEVTRGRAHPVLGNVDDVFELGEGSWKDKPYGKGSERFLLLVEKKTPERIPEFAEARQAVLQAYVSRKRAELSEALTRDLMTRYDVKILGDSKE